MNKHLQAFMESDEDGVFYIGHASALARINEMLVLFDPVWDWKPYGEYWYFDPEQINCNEILPLVDFCVISHIHEDHVCESILRRLNSNGCRTFIMSGRPELKARLNKYGCVVSEFEPFSPARRLGLEFTFIPHAFNKVDSSCIVRGRPSGFAVYHGNDNFLSSELIERVVALNVKIDVAMVPYAFIHWYPACMNMPEEEKLAEIQRLNKQSLAQAEAFVDAIKPVHTIPFGSNLLHYDNEFLNDNLTNPRHFVSALPISAGGYILGHKVFMPKTERIDPLRAIALKVQNAGSTVQDHQLVVNGYVIDMQRLLVYGGDPTGPYTRFDFKPKEFREWIAGKITFEQAIGTRQFTCTRVPNDYRLEVFEWFNKWL